MGRLRDSLMGIPDDVPLQPARPVSVKPVAAPIPLQGVGKRNHPDFAPVKVFVRKDTHKAARRKYEDEGGEDFSELCEKLLRAYLSA